jgi:beta-galactosidase
MLAERYKNSVPLIMWHISNEIQGECHCELCQSAFREWLKTRYNNSLDLLNEKWWTSFWSQTYSDWEQIESPASNGQRNLLGLNLDWKRFVTYQTVDFLKNEIKPIREITPEIPVTTNYMHLYFDLDYWKLAGEIDIISWDNYPGWHEFSSDIELAREVSFAHDMHRSYKGKPFLMMESTPSMTNWQTTAKLKRPKMHSLSSIQAVAHGSDSIQYFQWRKSRGASEKLHGAVIDHCGHDNTRVV